MYLLSNYISNSIQYSIYDLSNSIITQNEQIISYQMMIYELIMLLLSLIIPVKSPSINPFAYIISLSLLILMSYYYQLNHIHINLQISFLLIETIMVN